MPPSTNEWPASTLSTHTPSPAPQPGTNTSKPLSSNPKMLDPPTPLSPLFRLPLELREAIYTHLLTHTTLGLPFPPDPISRPRNIHTAILRTSRQLHFEALPTLYTRNRLIFSHPSDANMFRRALASPAGAAEVQTIVFRVKNSDTRLWTGYFLSTAGERSLLKDFPALRTVVLRFRGSRFQPMFSGEQNAGHWIRDPRLMECILAVRKGREVRVEVCVRVPEGWEQGWWERAVEKAVGEGGNAAEVVRDGEYAFCFGVWIKLETEGT